MKTTIHDDPTFALVAHRAALAAQDARAREARLAAARQEEEARFIGVERVAATFGRFLRRQPTRPQTAPALLRQPNEGEQAEPIQQRDAA
jgi:hypothetical protein